jgi:hypothetical protein
VPASKRKHDDQADEARHAAVVAIGMAVYKR